MTNNFFLKISEDLMFSKKGDRYPIAVGCEDGLLYVIITYDGHVNAYIEAPEDFEEGYYSAPEGKEFSYYGTLDWMDSPRNFVGWSYKPDEVLTVSEVVSDCLLTISD